MIPFNGKLHVTNTNIVAPNIMCSVYGHTQCTGKNKIHRTSTKRNRCELCNYVSINESLLNELVAPVIYAQQCLMPYA